MTDVVTEHLAWCEHRGLRPSTLAQRRGHLQRLSGALARQVPPRALLEVDAAALRTWQTSMTTGPQARAAAVKHARSFYRWAADVGLAEPRLLQHLVPPRLPVRLPRPIPQADLAVALVTAPVRLRPWLLLAAFAGLRACEVAALRAEDVDLTGLPPTVRVQGKGDRQRVVPLAPLLVDELRGLRVRRGPLFTGLTRRCEPTGRQITAERVSHLCSRYLHDSGSESTFHALRHRFLTDAWATSLDLRLVQDLAGHASPRETAGYAALVPGRAAAVVDQIAAASPVVTRALRLGHNVAGQRL